MCERARDSEREREYCEINNGIRHKIFSYYCYLFILFICIMIIPLHIAAISEDMPTFLAWKCSILVTIMYIYNWVFFGLIFGCRWSVHNINVDEEMRQN